MLDATTYRANETAAKQAIASWRIANINDPYIFENQGFPVRTESFLDLAQILDTMQEARFDFYMRELGGMTDEEADRFVDVCLDYIDFYQSVFQRERVVIPLSTMIAHLVIFEKLRGCDAKFGRLLEIGPGCGYLTFFLRNHAALTDYTQIETTESFYLLQSHINSHIFGSRFSEHAVHPDPASLHNFHMPKAKWYYQWHYEDQKMLDCERSVVCNHVPWWRTGDAADKQYDLVTSNANLNEFSEGALIQYLSIIRDAMKPDGVMVSQCLGGGTPTHDRVLDIMHAHDFATVAVVAGDQIPGKNYCVANGIFVRRGHPVYERFQHKPSSWPQVPRDVDFVSNALFLEDRPGLGRRPRSAQEIMELIASTAKQRKGVRRPTPVTGQTGDDDKPAVSKAVEIGRSLNESAGPGATSRPQTVMSEGQAAEIERLKRADKFRNYAAQAAPPLGHTAGGMDIDSMRRLVIATQTSTSWRLTRPLRLMVHRVRNPGHKLVEESYENVFDPHALRAKLDQLHSSTSWKITAPLRFMVSVLRGR